MAAAGYPRRRSADPVLPDDGYAYAHHPYRAALAHPLLGLSLRLCPRHLAQHSDAPGLGSQRHPDLSDFQHPVCPYCPDPGFCRAARPYHRHCPPGLWGIGDGLGGQCPPVETANHCRRAAVGADSAGIRIGAQHRFLGLRHGRNGQILAFHRLCPLLRRGRSPFRGVGGGLCADSAALVLRLAGLHPPRTH